MSKVELVAGLIDVFADAPFRADNLLEGDTDSLPSPKEPSSPLLCGCFFYGANKGAQSGWGVFRVALHKATCASVSSGEPLTFA